MLRDLGGFHLPLFSQDQLNANDKPRSVHTWLDLLNNFSASQMPNNWARTLPSCCWLVDPQGAESLGNVPILSLRWPSGMWGPDPPGVEMG